MAVITDNKQDWQIRSRGEQCGRCDTPFQDGEAFMARLTYSEDGYAREDVCMSCWPAVADEPALSKWQSVFRLPPPPPPETLKKETAESLLRKLMADDLAENTNAIYILAVMLERRRLLVEKDVQVRNDGLKLRIYEYRRTNETFVIPDPELKLAELQAVQEEVVTLLGGQDRPPRTDESEAAEPEPLPPTEES